MPRREAVPTEKLKSFKRADGVVTYWFRNKWRTEEEVAEERRRHALVRRESNKAGYKELRDSILDDLGGVCVRCGFSDKRALHIDHVYADGYQDRLKNRKSKGPRAYLLYIKENLGSGRFQLLCANCNRIKQVADKEFPEGNPLYFEEDENDESNDD